ncbi:MAG: hypothetical protein QGH94_03895 [Phycisphaerae bacterium]|nr:hypothetical protein [Phycisphaerae bacterium]
MKTHCISKAFFGLMIVALLGGRAAMAADAWIGPAPSGSAYPEGEADRRFKALSGDIRQRARIKGLEAQIYRKDTMILDTDRDALDIILRRSEALLADIAASPKAPKLDKIKSELANLKAAGAKVDPKDAKARRAIFDKVCVVRRKMAFSNPLLDFKELLILKRLLPGYNHMCDQYYGLAQRPGGGLYVLSDPFGAKPAIRSLLDKSVVANGRLKGKKLSGGPNKIWKVRYNGQGSAGGDATEGGSFLSPDLSFDGKTVAMAYVELTGEQKHDFHTDPTKGHWAKERSYHVFTVGVDGKNLKMLTDGTWNDFDPCFMPSGRIAFITERRGGYLRCGRVCPTYTLYDMAPDGKQIKCLSFHETNEWHPSVNHDGMIVWTRWDYVDRHGVTAHMPWTTTPDGRDPRAVHGNYSARKSRPDMEVDVRAIPGSHKYVAIGAPHHGHSLGSMIIVDPRAEDDDQMGPVKRMTPEVGFPETQGGKLVYGQPWPLSENYYICAYEPTAGRPGSTMYGIYLVDTFGNKELIYRDPSIACQSPIPVKARKKPPVIPEMSNRLASNPSKEATIGVVNVYNTRTPLPKGSKIKSLRVFQIFPKATVPINKPDIGIGSETLARGVLGTVPVEKDGSVNFTVPAGKLIYFQALDENGLAVQSMQSVTYTHPGETLTCLGCHESRHKASVPAASVKTALRRKPSTLKEAGVGSYPVCYPRLVQPVLDKKCVPCHTKNAKKKAPNLTGGPGSWKRGGYGGGTLIWSKSYISLTIDSKYSEGGPQKGFAFAFSGRPPGRTPTRTVPGQFGARGSKLYTHLKKHHDLKLTPEELSRITLWLDANSLFYGAYFDLEAQRKGKFVMPKLQ